MTPVVTCLIASGVLAQVCPSFTRSSSGNTGRCAIEASRGTNPTTSEWNALFAIAAQGASGPPVAPIGIGCNQPTPPSTTAAVFPCELFKAIAMQESSWRHFCAPTQPADQQGKPSQTIISFDCGYGIAQVTSGMRTFDAPAAFDRERVAREPLYNLATGLSILAEKWRVTSCVGDNQPTIIEHWYSATWAYNGLSATNNPNHPDFSTTRGVCRPGACSSAPYQERVFGWLEHPPSAAHWAPVALAYPRLSEIGVGVSRPPALPEPHCSGPASCASMRATHQTGCVPAVPDAGVAVPDAGSVTTIDAGSDAGSAALEPDAGMTGGSGSTTAASGCACQQVSVSEALWVTLALVARRRARNQ